MLEKKYSRVNWQNYPSSATPLGEVNLNKMDSTINYLEDTLISELQKIGYEVEFSNQVLYLKNEDGDIVSRTVIKADSLVVEPQLTSGQLIATLTVDNKIYKLYAPTGGGGGTGSSVIVESLLAEGTEIAKITVDGAESVVYAPGDGLNYTKLSNLPSINNVTLTGNKTLSQLGIPTAASVTALTSRVSALEAELGDATSRLEALL